MDIEVNLSVVDLIYALVFEQMFQEYQRLTDILGYFTFFFTFLLFVFFYFEYRDWNARLKQKTDLKKPIIVNILSDIVLLFVAYQLVIALSAGMTVYYTWFIIFLLIGTMYHGLRMFLYRQDEELRKLNLFDVSRDFPTFVILLIGKFLPLEISDWGYFSLIVIAFSLSLFINIILTRKVTKKISKPENLEVEV